MARHLARSDVRRMQQHRRLAVQLAVSTGTAVLAVLAVGLQANGSVTSFRHVPDHMPESRTSASASGYVAIAAAQESAPAAGTVSASADALLSYSRSVVLTGTKEETGKLSLASAELPRPAVGTLMAPLEALTPSSPYGLRTSPITGAAGEFHWGLDFAAACGTHVHSADAGVVRAVGWHQWGGGNRVELDHGNGLITTYNHLEGIAVSKGQSVQTGDIIAKVGTTGASTGCHLHFETILNGNHTDPAKWTLEPLHHSKPLANMMMADYRTTAGTVMDAPAWAVSAAQRHRHAGAKNGHEPPATIARTATSAPRSTPFTAPETTPSPSPAATAGPVPASAPLPKDALEPVKKPEPEPTPVPPATEAAAPPAP